MFRLSKMTDYALVLLQVMAGSERELWGAQTLVQETHLPLPTVRKCLKLLTDADLLVSFRGATGGYRLAQESADISLGQVMVAIEGPLALAECSRPDGGHCALDGKCELKLPLKSISQIVMNYLSTISLRDLLYVEDVDQLSLQQVRLTERVSH